MTLIQASLIGFLAACLGLSPDLAYALRPQPDRSGLEEALLAGPEEVQKQTANLDELKLDFAIPVESMDQVGARAKRKSFLIKSRPTLHELEQKLKIRIREYGIQGVIAHGTPYLFVRVGRKRSVRTDEERIYHAVRQQGKRVTRMVLVHNHDDGMPVPSSADFRSLRWHLRRRAIQREFIYGSYSGTIVEYGIHRGRPGHEFQGVRLRIWRQAEQKPVEEWIPWSIARAVHSIPPSYFYGAIRRMKPIRVEAEDRYGRWFRWEQGLTLAAILKDWIKPVSTGQEAVVGHPSAQAAGLEELAGKSIPEWVAQLALVRREPYQEAVRALVQIGEPAVPFLREILKRDQEAVGEAPPRGTRKAAGPRIRRAAAYLLGQIGPAAADPDTLKVLSETLAFDGSAWVRREAAAALGKMGSAAKAALQDLREAKDDSWPLVWQAALKAIRQIDPAAVPSEIGERWIPGKPVWSLAFSPDDAVLASSSENARIRLHRFGVGESVVDLSHRQMSALADLCLAFSPDGKGIASGDSMGTVRLLDSSSGQPLWIRHGRKMSHHQEGVLGVAFSLDGKTLISASGKGTVLLWDVQNGGILRRMSVPEAGTIRYLSQDPTLMEKAAEADWITSFAFNPKKEILALGRSDGLIRLWKVSRERSQLLHELRSSANGGAWSLALSSDGSRLTSGVGEGPIELWDAETGQSHGLLTGHDRRVWSLAFSPDGSVLASGDAGGNVQLRPLGNPLGERPFWIENDSVGAVFGLAFSHDGKNLAMATASGRVQFHPLFSLLGAGLEEGRAHEQLLEYS